VSSGSWGVRQDLFHYMRMTNEHGTFLLAILQMQYSQIQCMRLGERVQNIQVSIPSPMVMMVAQSLCQNPLVSRTANNLKAILNGTSLVEPSQTTGQNTLLSTFNLSKKTVGDLHSCTVTNVRAPQQRTEPVNKHFHPHRLTR
jgi:hypothetical protein